MLFVDKIYTSTNEKETFIKGLILLELADGVISETESEFIYNRAKILDYSKKMVDDLVNNLKNCNYKQYLNEIVFSTPYQATYFLAQAIRLGYQDGCYSEEEIDAMRIIAANNGVEKFTLSMLEAIAKLEDDLILERQKILDSYL